MVDLPTKMTSQSHETRAGTVLMLSTSLRSKAYLGGRFVFWGRGREVSERASLREIEVLRVEG